MSNEDGHKISVSKLLEKLECLGVDISPMVDYLESVTVKNLPA